MFREKDMFIDIWLGGMLVRDLLPFFKALGDEKRILIIKLLLEKEYCVADLQEELNLSQAAVSHHLKILKQSGFLKDRSSGTWTYYALDRQGFDVYSHMLDENLFEQVAKSTARTNNVQIDGYEKYRLRLFHWLIPFAIIFSILLGLFLKVKLPTFCHYLQGITIGKVNAPMLLVLFLLLYTLLVQLEFNRLGDFLGYLKPIIFSSLINWFIKPLALLLIGSLFIGLWGERLGILNGETISHLFLGLVLLGLAPASSLALSWVHYERLKMPLASVVTSINILLLFIVFSPLAMYLFKVIGSPISPVRILLFLAFLAFTILSCYVSRLYLIRTKGEEWFVEVFVKNMNIWAISFCLFAVFLLILLRDGSPLPSSSAILLAALVLIGGSLFIFTIYYALGRVWKLKPIDLAAPAILGLRNNFEFMLIAGVIIFGINSGAIYIGVLAAVLEIPLLLLLNYILGRFPYLTKDIEEGQPVVLEE